MEKYLRRVLLETRIPPATFIMAGAYLVFFNTFWNSWTYDDFSVVVNNPDIRSFQLFVRDLLGGRVIRDLTLAIDYYFFGLTPVGYHIQNIFWHGLNAWLIFILVGRLGDSKSAAWTASLLFLVHPIQVEVVANIANRKDSLCLAFSLLSLLAYIHSFQFAKRRWIWLVVALCAAYVAMLAKENAYVLPLIFVGYEKAFLPQEERLLLRKTWPWILGLVTGVVGFFIWYLYLDGRNELLNECVRRLARINFFSESSVSIYYATTLKSWAFMVTKLILPVKLSPDYIYSVPTHWRDIWIISTVIGLSLYAFLLIFSLKRSAIAFFALVWFGAFWLPTSNIWPQFTSFFAADRYLYAPSVGFFIISGLFLTRIIKNPRVRVLIVLCLVSSLSILSWHQNMVWRSHSTLWTHVEKVSPNSTIALNGLGLIHIQKGDYDRAIDYFSRSININPYFPSLYANIGRAYEAKGEIQTAIKYYRKYIAMNPQKGQFKTIMIREHLKKRYGITF